MAHNEPIHGRSCELSDEHLRLLQRWQKLREELDASDSSYDKSEFARVTQKLRESQAALQEFTWRLGTAVKR